MKKDSEQDINIVQMEKLRQQMVAAAQQYGINHPIVLWYSQQIDEKHNNILFNRTI